LAARNYTLTIRADSRARKERFSELSTALATLEERGRELQATAHERPVGGTLIRRLEPVQIVVARLELKGPAGLHAGVDVRGDGSSEAFTGRIRRQVLDQRPGEDPYEALRRAVS
jgi:hypothetical protein